MHVTLIAAQSLDGYITFHGQPGSEFTSEADKKYFRETLRNYDCRVMGAESYRTTRDMTRRAAAGGADIVITTRHPERFSADVIPEKLEFTSGTPREILQQFSAKGRANCALLGGGQTYSRFLAEGCVDELWLTIEPRLFGGGTRLLAKETDTKLSLQSNETLSANTLLLKYRVIRK
ncbi:MAG TPA: dihydrofolate reductase family protein [Opitutaceae bacterium]|nr:dihydrofolate reductase family protein [Opitutaceae bacterium]